MARRHTSTSRTRAVAADTEDVLLEKTLAFGSWAQQNRQTLILIGIGILALLMGSLYYWNYRRQHLQRAAVELERVEQAAAFGDTSTAKVELSQFVESFGNTPYGDEARLLLGQIYLESGQPQEAVTLLTDAADLSKPIGVQVGVLLGKAHEQKGDFKAAEETFLRVADRSKLEFEKRGALEEAARVRTLQGNLAGAIELYQRILDDLDATAPERGMYEMRMQELKEKSQQAG
jgi:predicted negative regulator of RcsB-dependent stress response